MSTSERRIYFNEQGYEKVIMCMSRTRNADYHPSSSAGGSKTKNGRKIGTELAKIYFEKPQQKKAENLARELFEIQKNNGDEIELAGKNAVLLADILRSQNKNAESANMFLPAAVLSV